MIMERLCHSSLLDFLVGGAIATLWAIAVIRRLPIRHEQFLTFFDAHVMTANQFANFKFQAVFRARVVFAGFEVRWPKIPKRIRSAEREGHEMVDFIAARVLDAVGAIGGLFHLRRRLAHRGRIAVLANESDIGCRDLAGRELWVGSILNRLRRRDKQEEEEKEEEAFEHGNREEAKKTTSGIADGRGAETRTRSLKYTN